MSEGTSRACGGCPEPIVSISDSLTCSSCKNYYHQSCIFPGRKAPPGLTSWLCPVCKPRTVPSDNTPVRPKNAGHMTSEDANVTHRKKGTPVAAPIMDPVALTSDMVRAIVKAEISDLLKHLNDTMANFVNKELKSIKEEISSVKESMNFMNNQYEDIRSEVKAKFSTVDKLQKENEKLIDNIKNLSMRVNTMEQQARSCNIEIQCLPESKTENLVSTVMNMSKVISCKISESDIHNVTRIAKINPESTRPRSIVVQFSSPKVRDAFLAASIKYNKINPQDKLNTFALGIGNTKQNVYIVEHLSAYYKAVHAAARKRAKELGYKYVWVRNGRIFMRKSDDSDYKYIKNCDMLVSLE